MATIIGSAPTQAPTAITLADMRDEVARFIKMPNDEEGLQLCLDGILGAIRKLNSRNWGWAVNYQTITLVADQGDYDLAQLFRSPLWLEVRDTNDKPVYRLPYLVPKIFEDQYPDRATSGSPYCYTIIAPFTLGKLTLSCPPDAGFISQYPTLRLWQHQRIAETQDLNIPLSIPSEAVNFILWQGRASASAVKQPTLYAMAAREAADAWMFLIAAEADPQTSDWGE